MDPCIFSYTQTLTSDLDLAICLKKHLSQIYIMNSMENPLLNPEVLAEVFKKCAIADLKGCRQVCRLWRDGSKSQFATRATICLDNESTGPFADSMRSHPPREPSKSFRSFKLTRWGCYGSQEEVAVWISCGQFMRQLELKEFQEGLSLNATFLNLKALAPNLESLAVSDTNWELVSLPGRGRLEGVGEFGPLRLSAAESFDKLTTLEFNSSVISRWDVVLQHVPNLETLIIRNVPTKQSEPLSELKELLQAIKTIREDDPNKINLKHLDILDFYQKYIYTLNVQRPINTCDLLELRLPLETLKLDVGWKTSSKNVQNLLKSYNGSLKTLEIFRFPQVTVRYGGTPCPKPTLLQGLTLESLEELRLWGIMVSDLSFLVGMENLKKLRINKACQEKKDKFSGGMAPCDHSADDLLKRSNITLRGLRMDHLTHVDMDYQFGPQQLQLLFGVMPNLSSIKLILTDEALAAVSRLWRNVRELKARFGSVISDDGILSMRQLNFLRIFELECCCEKAKLTDASVSGFLKNMPYLDYMNIHVSSQMRQESVNQMKRAILDVKVVQNCCKTGLWGARSCCVFWMCPDHK